MTKAKITAAERRKIEALIQEARRLAERHRFTLDNTDIIISDRLLDDLADVAQRYLEALK